MRIKAQGRAYDDMAAAGKAYSKQSVKKTGRERKEKLVAEIVEKIDASNGLVFTDYKGISHQQLESLRRELKSVDSSLLIAKNSLMKISLGKSKNFADYKDNEALVGTAATLFIGKDSIEPLKKLQKSIKDTGLPTVKFGILEGQLLDEAGVLKLASLPGRDVLVAQFVGLLNAPIQRLVSGLNAIPQKFVMTLDAVAKAKPSDSSAATPEPTPAPEPKANEETTKEDKSADAVQNEDSAEAPAPAQTEDKSEPANQDANDTQNDNQNNEGGEKK